MHAQSNKPFRFLARIPELMTSDEKEPSSYILIVDNGNQSTCQQIVTLKSNLVQKSY